MNDSPIKFLRKKIQNISKQTSNPCKLLIQWSKNHCLQIKIFQSNKAWKPKVLIDPTKKNFKISKDQILNAFQV